MRRYVEDMRRQEQEERAETIAAASDAAKRLFVGQTVDTVVRGYQRTAVITKIGRTKVTEMPPILHCERSGSGGFCTERAVMYRAVMYRE
jgi:hypothetical protein